MFRDRKGAQSLYLSRWPATQLRGSSLSESRLQLHWNPQTLWCVCAKSAMHQRPFSVSEHPPARTRPATRPRVSQHARICSRPATEKKGGSTVRRTEESNRAASPATAEIEVCAGAVLPGRSCAEPQTLGAVPQPTTNLNGSRHLEKKREPTRHHSHAQHKVASNTEFFNISNDCRPCQGTWAFGLGKFTHTFPCSAYALVPFERVTVVLLRRFMSNRMARPV